MSEMPPYPSYAPVLIRLLQGVLYHDDSLLWNELLDNQAKIQGWFAAIGVTVHVFESDGFAYLKQIDHSDQPEWQLPPLVRKRQLSYPVTLLSILLLERLLEFEAGGGEAGIPVISKSDMKEMLRLFLPDSTNESKLLDQIDTHINKLVDYGFLRQLKDADQYEIKKILKARIRPEELEEVKFKLQEHLGLESDVPALSSSSPDLTSPNGTTHE